MSACHPVLTATANIFPVLFDGRIHIICAQLLADAHVELKEGIHGKGVEKEMERMPWARK
jgi:hypothetical protein